MILPLVAAVFVGADASPSVVSAEELFAAYRDNEFAAAKMYKGRSVQMVAPLRQVRGGIGSEVSLMLGDSPSSGVRCVATKSQLPIIEKLQPGDLVGVTGVVTERVLVSVMMTPCRIEWFAREKLPERDATVIARSMEICLAAVAERTFAKPSAEQAELVESMQKLRSNARQDLKRLGASQMPCKHPAVSFATRCEVDDRFGATACSSAPLTSILARLQREP